MKLLNKTSLIIITLTLFIFFSGGVSFFYLIRSLINQETDRELISYSNNLVGEMQLFEKAAPNSIFITENNVEMKRVDSFSFTQAFFSDTILFDPRFNKRFPHRVYSFPADLGFRKYEVSVYRSTYQSEKLIERIVLSLTVMFILLILSLYFLNRYLFKRIWDDFFYTLDKIRSFEIKQGREFYLKDSEIEEFQQLNQAIIKLMDKIRQDYRNLKDFTENASHELQTPLAIMQSKIELFLQHDDLKEEHLELLSGLYEAVNRLAQMNRALILLTKIENNQFPEKEAVALHERIDYHVDQLQAIIEEKEIQLKVNTKALFKEMSPALADILLMNLIKNALRHNDRGGSVEIELSNDKLIVQNTGAPSELPAEKLFNRFTKSGKNKESIGLGLAIVKRIVDLYDWKIDYKFEEGKNKFILHF